MNKIPVFFLIIIAALNFVLLATMQSKADIKNFDSIVPFSMNNDRVGFFDRNSGMIYIYDNIENKCLFIGQIHSLGQPIEVLTAKSVDGFNQ